MSKLGEPYQPSNGTEMMQFSDEFCDRCLRDKPFRDSQRGESGCAILAKLYLLEVTDVHYPKALTYNSEGHPTCTAFVDEAEAPALADIARRRCLEAAGQANLFPPPVGDSPNQSAH